ncbi:fasciclin domain-containing protein [Lutimaribacter sp. EGI FJ00015]|uniref:Fasciclin domain-containing protein n=1 Tax=Lutimaribacter degradans TaxID=2945989 RepID=A0ACC5ZXS9_9RHOB|nr:fasciclin domain-containing protein [Lutimaribacter sp. EGI FJ00013]MCM2562728.1 fasciclin domain-containing protein [Lutimaribacter sp. EGI FJ00013]MCO0613885.1 fasciclin domain-containing protein [Lutimaribacter sp. EGI FJ00015]MCO0636857.1 fasciclin domain-containing protein [Lutimaribacter sp. EGI FJ00014]
MKRRTFFAAVAAAGLTAAAGCTTTTTQPDVVDILAANDEFSTLVAAVGAADLAGTLKGDGPFTVFAPTNAAFEKLPAGTVESLLRPENRDQLASILTYHVVPGAVTSDQLAGQRLDVKTVQGTTVDVNGTHGVRVNNARVIQADVAGSNGVIHVIDSVLLPN